VKSRSREADHGERAREEEHVPCEAAAPEKGAERTVLCAGEKPARAEAGERGTEQAEGQRSGPKVDEDRDLSHVRELALVFRKKSGERPKEVLKAWARGP
jgi:hypothetical protein